MPKQVKKKVTTRNVKLKLTALRSKLKSLTAADRATYTKRLNALVAAAQKDAQAHGVVGADTYFQAIPAGTHVREVDGVLVDNQTGLPVHHVSNAQPTPPQPSAAPVAVVQPAPVYDWALPFANQLDALYTTVEQRVKVVAKGAVDAAAYTTKRLVTDPTNDVADSLAWLVWPLAIGLGALVLLKRG